jgi:CRISPR-associated protein Csc1
MKIIEVVLETQGKIGFASREVGRTADTADYLLNTALHYAFGFAVGRYVDTIHQPTYVEDTAEIADELYITPAAPLEQPEYWTTIYNARGDKYTTVNYPAAEDPDQDINIPRFGRERAFSHGNEFRCYILPYEMTAHDVCADLPSYIRLGKKRGKAKLRSRIVEARREQGQFSLNHPIGVYDYEETPLGSVISKNMRPTPLILQANYDDEHFAISRGKNEPPVKLPANLRFLETKR